LSPLNNGEIKEKEQKNNNFIKKWKKRELRTSINLCSSTL